MTELNMATDQRPFTMVYDDFLESEMLTPYEKLVFIYLKKYADKENKCFPSLNTLSKVSGISKRKVQDCIKSLQEKGVLTVKQRRKDNQGLTSNLYTLHDTAAQWTKKELPSSLPTSDESSEKVAHISSLSNIKYKDEKSQSQVTEVYSMEFLRDRFGYDALEAQDPKDVESVFSILYDTLNTQKHTIKIDGVERPTMIVVSKLMKLDYSDISYVIDRYNEQTERIQKPTAYLLTQLYHAKEQSHLDLMNEGHCNGDF